MPNFYTWEQEVTKGIKEHGLLQYVRLLHKKIRQLEAFRKSVNFLAMETLEDIDMTKIEKMLSEDKDGLELIQGIQE